MFHCIFWDVVLTSYYLINRMLYSKVGSTLYFVSSINLVFSSTTGLWGACALSTLGYDKLTPCALKCVSYSRMQKRYRLFSLDLQLC